MADAQDHFFELLREAVHGKKYSAEMWSEALREAGTLVFVFAPLYKMLEKSDASWWTVITALIVGTAFMGLGIEVERRRK